MPNIVLSRDRGWADRIRKYQVIIDDKIVGKIGFGETVEYPCSEGLHTIQVKIDWARTKCITVDITTENKRFQVASNLRGWRIFLCICYMFIPSKWILLEEVTDSPG